MSVLVTGASGLIGGRLLRHFLDSGRDVLVAGSRSDREWPEGVEGRLLDYERPSTLVRACAGIQVVVNLAGMSESACENDPRQALRQNAGGVLSLAIAAVDAGVPRFVQISTAKVYGPNLSGVISELTPLQPRSHYAISHRIAEDYAMFLHPGSVVIRLANSFGSPAEPTPGGWQVIVNEICRQAVTDRKIQLRSSGQSLRNFIPLADVVRALRFAANEIPPGIYNLGSSSSRTLLSMASMVADVCLSRLGFRPEVSVSTSELDRPTPDLDYRVDKLRSLGFNTEECFEEEIANTLSMAQTVWA